MQRRGGPTGVARQVPSLTASSLPKHPSNPLAFEEVEEVAAPGGVHQQGDGAAGEDRVLSTRKATELGYTRSSACHGSSTLGAGMAAHWQKTQKPGLDNISERRRPTASLQHWCGLCGCQFALIPGGKAWAPETWQAAWARAAAAGCASAPAPRSAGCAAGRRHCCRHPPRRCRSQPLRLILLVSAAQAAAGWSCARGTRTAVPGETETQWAV